MKRFARNGVLVVAAASGAMAVAGPAFADSAADGSAADSPGVASGNSIQLPVHVPVNVCGNTVNVLGLLNPVAGNSCANEGGSRGGGSGGSSTSGGASAQSVESDSPGLLSGNGIQAPVDVPVNVSGNSVNVVGIGNPVFGNESVNGPGEPPATSTPEPPAPPRSERTPPEPQAPPATREVPPTGPSLAHTGADATVPAVAGGAVLLLAGTVLYRRFRPHQGR
ncbi:chaplin family protein [Streptomyces sp. NPDC026672]|uniref:chaplin family protein n=1 Tax=unclassified Streptomyces TaxID=2593676 RepID=UPI0033C57712